MRTCLWCPHFHVEQASQPCCAEDGYTDFRITCYRSRWNFDAYAITEAQFRQILLSAQDCEDYTRVTEVGS
jgi:hypothetical protein